MANESEGKGAAAPRTPLEWAESIGAQVAERGFVTPEDFADTIRAARTASDAEIERLRALLRDIDADLALGFVVCGRCGHEESTAHFDVRFLVKHALAEDSPKDLGPAPKNPNENHD